MPVWVELGGEHLWGCPLSPPGVVFQNLPEFQLNVVALPPSTTGTVTATALSSRYLAHHKVATLFGVAASLSCCQQACVRMLEQHNLQLNSYVKDVT
jgi:hypothetical protein